MKSSARKFSLISCMAVFLLAAAPFTKADPIPYPNPGTVAPTPTLTATATGNVTGYFFSYSASDNDSIELVDLTPGHQFTSAPLLDNMTSTPGVTSVDFGFVHAGDKLAFVLVNNTTHQDFSSDPALSSDGINHAYATPFLGASDPAGDPDGIPAGTYVGMEDESRRGNPPSDLDYNDDTFVFTDVSCVVPPAVTPEPSSFILLGSGLFAAAGMVRRRIKS
jgi:PEP-CTERM motif